MKILLTGTISTYIRGKPVHRNTSSWIVKIKPGLFSGHGQKKCSQATTRQR